MIKIICLILMLGVVGCHKLDGLFQKVKLPDDLSGIIFKETSRDPKKKEVEGQTQRIIFSFNEEVLEFALSCLFKNNRVTPQEMFSDRSIAIILKDKAPHPSRMSFEIPGDFNITLKVTENFTYYNENNEDQTDVCIETLKTGNYQFYPEADGLFEVQVNGQFYMYMRKE